MKRKLVIATIGLALIFSSVVSVATLRALAVRHDHNQFLAWEHRLVRPDDLSRLGVAFFNMNGIISVVYLAGVVLAVLVPHLVG